eukprot:RCo043767
MAEVNLTKTLNNRSERRPARRVQGDKRDRKDNPICFMELTIAKRPVGRITLELFADVCPKTAENFRCLCTGEKGTGKAGKKLCYESSSFHRVIPGFIVQGGDITRNNGTGGESIFGDKFPDENFTLRHTGPGILSMANAGANTNNSQFFITLAATPHLDRKHVVFGRIMRGFEVMKELAKVPTDKDDFPQQPIVISKCGQVNKTKVELPVEEAKEVILSTEDEQAARERQRREQEQAEQ